MRTGRRLAFDVGAARTGVAVSSADGIFASPLGVVANVDEALLQIAEYQPIEIYVGLPLSLSGNTTKSTAAAIAFGNALLQRGTVAVRFIDERLTTSAAASLMRSAGKNARQAKSGIDAAAATLILEQALAIERAGRLPGTSIEELE